MGYRYEECKRCDADNCDCGCSSCKGELVRTCIRCDKPMHFDWMHSKTWVCTPGCEPKDRSRLNRDVAECRECEELVPSRSMVATATGIYCSVYCAGKAAIAATPRVACPVCEDAPGAPQFGGACDEICAERISADVKGVA